MTPYSSSEQVLCGRMAKQVLIERVFQPYLPFSGELMLQNGLLLYGNRTVIPASLRADMLTKLHMGDLGITKSRDRAKQSVWWPGLSRELTKMIENCDTHGCERTNLKDK